MAASDRPDEDISTMEVVIERVFDAPRERVFDAFTRPEHLRKWWGPNMVTIPLAEFDARPGGRIFIAERDPDGAMRYIAGVVLEIERPSRLVFAIHFADADGRRVAPPVGAGLPGNWDDEIVSSVMLSAEGRGTRVSIGVQRSGVTPVWAELARMGWAESLDKLGDAITDEMP